MANALDRINVQNNPVNLIDPLGLISAGQLGIGNPGTHGGENDCESMYDDLSDAPYLEGYFPIEISYSMIIPMGGFANGGKALIIKIAERFGIYAKKIGGGGRLQSYSRLTGRYVSQGKTLGGKIHKASMTKIGQFTTGFSQGLVSSQSGGVAPPPAVTTLQAWGQAVGNFLGAFK